MNTKNFAGPGLKRKAIHEFLGFAGIFLFLAFFLCALATYSMLLLSEFHVRYLSYAFALINALVIAKVILIGEYAHLGRKYETRPLFLSAIYKTLLFSLLVFGFHLCEEVLKRLMHGASIAKASQEMRVDEVLGRSIIVFCILIPLFVLRELRRVLGQDNFHALFFRSREMDKSDPAPETDR
jgi:hypothetical protein